MINQGAVVGGDGVHRRDHAHADRLAAPGRDRRYSVSDRGWELFDQLGIVVPAGSRRLTGYCVDWTEQRHHLAGAVGAALLGRFEQLDWLTRGARGNPRALEITAAGEQGFARHFAIDTTVLGGSHVSAAPESRAT